MSNDLTPAPTLTDPRTQRDEILALATHYGVTNVRVFGSVARGEASPISDVDLPDDFSLLDLSGLVHELQLLVGFPVQIASAAHLREDMRPSILRDAQDL